MILVNGETGDRILALDRGLAYGDGVFRTMRACNGRIQHWSYHFTKLSSDCKRLGIPCIAEEDLVADTQRLLDADPNCVVKVIATRGSGGRGYAPPSAASVVRIVATFPLTEVPADRSDVGVRARWCTTPVAMHSGLAGVKHLNRLDSVLARGEWSDGDIAEGIMLDRDGWVVQGTMSNVLILEDSHLITPTLDAAGVAGVQRERIMSLAQHLGLHCMEEHISQERLIQAEQVYVCNSVIAIWWISSLASRRWNRHALTPRLLELVARDRDV